ncbi:MAG: glycogen debranching enzyme N-terminal domain-containing protein [Prevotellaceae bacterium]|nr:glycogen debranching enzyme N-terminal domain-containing protein [Prevotellaceae bacterium]
MSYLSFDRNLLVNLEKSLKKEILRTNRSGAYNSSSIIDCNTRKYHGQLVLPLPDLDDENHVLLSSLDETVIQYGAEFNLGVHKYSYNNFSPNGHKYLRSFEFNVVSQSLYRLGGVIMSKERLMLSHEPRVLIRYTLIDAPAAIKLRFKPFLAFRSVNTLTHANDTADKSYSEADNGISVCMYKGYPCLFMQFSEKPEYVHQPDWYKGVEYAKEQERGYDFTEDLYVPGYFEVPLEKGGDIIFAGGIEPIDTRTLRSIWNEEKDKRKEKNSLFDYLKNAAIQLYKKEGNFDSILAGYPWFKARARDQFVSLPGATLCIDKTDYFEKVMESALPEIKQFISEEGFVSKKLQELDAPDVLLWFVWAVQQYGIYTSQEQMLEKYGDIVIEVIKFIRAQKHKNLFVHTNGLLFCEGRTQAATWMNAVENGYPITPRTGYIVEINALWFNALKFAVEILKARQEHHTADIFNYQSEILRNSFVEKFWNGTYLNDYVIDNYADKEVRPNMIFAVSLPFSPLDRQQQKAVLDICTKELLTPKGLRSLSPKSGSYRPIYIGGMLERNRNYHNGPVWAWTLGAYADAYLKIYKQSGVSFIERIVFNFEGVIREHCVGTISELFDGNPPFNGHGGMSFAMNVSEILRVLKILENYDK